MNRRKLSLPEYAALVAEALPKGILLTSRADDRVNTMVIGWGAVGVTWNRPVFTALVRTGRFTRSLLDRNPEFTVNLPQGEPDRNVIAVCGRKSGRELDKLAACDLHTVPGEAVSVPAIREFPVTIECRILYRQEQDPALLPEELQERFYPANQDSSASGSNCDPHVTYFGQIVAAYVLEPEEGETGA